MTLALPLVWCSEAYFMHTYCSVLGLIVPSERESQRHVSKSIPLLQNSSAALPGAALSCPEHHL